MEKFRSIIFAVAWLLPAISSAYDYDGLKAELSQALSMRLEEYEEFSHEDASSVAKGRSQIKSEIIKISEALSGKPSSSVVSVILEKHHLDEVPRSIAVELLSEIYKSNKLNPRYTLNANIEIALARLGHEEAFRNIVANLDSENSTIKLQAFSKLASVGTDTSLEILGEFLLGNTDKAFPAMTAHGHSLGTPSSQVYAMMALSEEFGELETNYRKSTEERLKNWQEWWSHDYWKKKLDVEGNTNGIAMQVSKMQPNPISDSIDKESLGISAEPSEEPTGQPSQWWLWLIGAVIVVGGIALIVRRKS